MNTLSEAVERLKDDLKTEYSGGGYIYVEANPRDIRTVLDALESVTRERDLMESRWLAARELMRMAEEKLAAALAVIEQAKMPFIETPDLRSEDGWWPMGQDSDEFKAGARWAENWWREKVQSVLSQSPTDALAVRDRRVKAEALREAAKEFFIPSQGPASYLDVEFAEALGSEFLKHYADRIEKGADDDE